MRSIPGTPPGRLQRRALGMVLAVQEGRRVSAAMPGQSACHGTHGEELVSCERGPVTWLGPHDGSFLAWNVSWNGGPDNPVQRVRSGRYPVSSVLLVRSVHDAVVMVRGRPTIRFRNGVPGHMQFSNYLTGGAERALETLLSSHRSESSHGTALARAAATEGRRRRAVPPCALRTCRIADVAVLHRYASP